MYLLWLLSGLAALGVGGEMLVRGAVGAARRLGVSPLLVGLTIVGFGTSTPELVTSLVAALEEAPGIAVGNVVGSNIANLLLILGSAALVAPLPLARVALRREGIALAGSTAVCVLVILHGKLDLLPGMMLVAVLFAYVAWAYTSERKLHGVRTTVHEQVAEDAAPQARSFGVYLGMCAGGIAMTVLGAHWLVDSAIELSRRLGIPETVIGLSVVAVGTSLPELVASLVAAARGHAEVALGNIIGSNVYNVLGILGATAIIHPIRVPAEIARVDIWILLAATMLLLFFLRTGTRIGRVEGAILLGGYALYAAWLGLGSQPG
ncbi:calcium/sodium antiporter [Dokdonella immobilis]|uniref:Cation:H+ antiporter n=1 Tax=Dokdonella immobilis TaxID=578942 RepID=A0A1I4YUP4_9GAMM|nr:calcium/sodium antiporter [Dokdonella immobilis]SFN41741.1 cation:H+ antiporter [Dokdonella immobilis]